MSDLAIEVKGLSKRYRIGVRDQYPTLRDALIRAVSQPLRAVRSWAAAQDHAELAVVWALRDIDLEVHQGEVVGIIGRNGAGKSTLLKVFSGITEPTAGYADIYGRVGSLLEVGTGFHMELTGRENIFLNGALLGMRRREIQRKFDEIVAFAEVEKFLDTPVKRYSSGMYMRLAFAVAAHLDPEILIVDEVLAVGDVQFQRKCLGKMQDVSRSQGRTVLFVSHNMDAIQRLCSKCILLESGQLIIAGNTADVVGEYLSRNFTQGRPHQWINLSHASRVGTGEARITSVQYSSPNKSAAFHAYSSGPLEFLLAIEAQTSVSITNLAVTVYSRSGTKLVNADTASVGQVITLAKGRNLVQVRIRELHLKPDVYVVGLWLANPPAAPFDDLEAAFEIEVVNSAWQGLSWGAKAEGAVTCSFEVIQLTAEPKAMEASRAES